MGAEHKFGPDRDPIERYYDFVSSDPGSLTMHVAASGGEVGFDRKKQQLHIDAAYYYLEITGGDPESMEAYYEARKKVTKLVQQWMEADQQP